MTHAITPAASVEPRTPRTVIDWQVIYPPFPLGNAEAFGHAKPAPQSQKPDGLVQMQIKRELLAAKAQHARNRSRINEASLTELELRAVTHQALRLEVEMMRARKC